MEREIKFRGKSVESGDWVYGNLVVLDVYKDSLIIPFDSSVGRIDDEYGFGEAIPVTPKSVGGFIGRKDNNGVEIYKGDIIDWGKWKKNKYSDPSGERGVIEYLSDMAGFIVRLRSSYGGEGFASVEKFLELRRTSPLKYRKFKVIGNTADNPELLKQPYSPKT